MSSSGFDSIVACVRLLLIQFWPLAVRKALGESNIVVEVGSWPRKGGDDLTKVNRLTVLLANTSSSKLATRVSKFSQRTHIKLP